MKISKNNWAYVWATIDTRFFNWIGCDPQEMPQIPTLCVLVSKMIGNCFFPVFVIVIMLPFLGIIFICVAPVYFLFEWLPNHTIGKARKSKVANYLLAQWKNSITRTAILDLKNKTCTKIEIE